MAYTVALVTDTVEVGTSDPSTLQGVTRNGASEWETKAAARRVAEALAKFGLRAAVLDEQNVVVHCN